MQISHQDKAEYMRARKKAAAAGQRLIVVGFAKFVTPHSEGRKGLPDTNTCKSDQLLMAKAAFNKSLPQSMSMFPGTIQELSGRDRFKWR